MSSGLWRCLEQAEEVAGEGALEAADRLARALALAEAALDVGDCGRVLLAAADDDRVQRAVELAIAAAVEAVAHDHARAGRDGRWPCPGGGRGFWGQGTSVR